MCVRGKKKYRLKKASHTLIIVETRVKLLTSLKAIHSIKKEKKNAPACYEGNVFHAVRTKNRRNREFRF